MKKFCVTLWKGEGRFHYGVRHMFSSLLHCTETMSVETKELGYRPN